MDDCNIADPSIVCAKKAEPGVLIKGMQDWIYRDPQGEIQGKAACESIRFYGSISNYLKNKCLVNFLQREGIHDEISNLQALKVSILCLFMLFMFFMNPIFSSRSIFF